MLKGSVQISAPTKEGAVRELTRLFKKHNINGKIKKVVYDGNGVNLISGIEDYFWELKVEIPNKAREAFEDILPGVI